MREHFRFGRGRSVGVNLTPMIDVVFLLLIFFVLIAQFSSRERAEIELPWPEPSAAKYAYSPDALTVTVICSETGQLAAYQAQGQMISPAQISVLEGMLLEKKKAAPELEVNIRADRRADGKVIEGLMASCARAGIRRINLVAAIEQE